MDDDKSPAIHSHDVKYLTRKDAAAYLKRTCGFGAVATLNRLASQGGGPAFRRAGGRIALYTIADLDAWAEAQIGPRQTSTSDVPRTDKAPRKGSPGWPITQGARSRRCRGDGVTSSISIVGKRQKRHDLNTNTIRVNLFPIIEGDAFLELVDDIRANGLIEPIIIFEDKVLDEEIVNGSGSRPASKSAPRSSRAPAKKLSASFSA